MPECDPQRAQRHRGAARACCLLPGEPVFDRDAFVARAPGNASHPDAVKHYTSACAGGGEIVLHRNLQIHAVPPRDFIAQPRDGLSPARVLVEQAHLANPEHALSLRDSVNQQRRAHSTPAQDRNLLHHFHSRRKRSRDGKPAIPP
jgi:hypothetical protein